MTSITTRRASVGAVALVAAVALGALVACSGGTTPSGVLPVASGSAPGTVHPGSAHLLIKIPPKTPGSGHGRPRYVSPGTQSMTVSVQGASSKAFNLTTSSRNCATGAGGYRTCQEAMSVPSGQQTLTVSLFDQQNGKGDQLATATTSVKIAATGFTDIPITLGGIVAGVQVQLAGNLSTGSAAIGTPTSLPLIVNAYDASGSLIVAPGNYSSPITLTNTSATFSFTASAAITKPHAQSVPAFALSPSGVPRSEIGSGLHVAKDLTRKPKDTMTISAPGTNATVYYNGQFFASNTITPSVKGMPETSGAAVVTGTYAMTLSNPTANLGELATNQALSIATGPDSALWVAPGWGGTNVGGVPILRMTTGLAITPFLDTGVQGLSGGTGNDVTSMTTGPDGALWFNLTSSAGENYIGRTTTGGTFTNYPVPTNASCLYDIAPGMDGAVWFTERGAGKIGRIPTNATPGSSAQITEYSIPTAGSLPIGIVAGPDGAMWFTEHGTSKIGRISATGTITEFALPSGYEPAQSFNDSIALGSDGNLWFTEWTSAAGVAGLQSGIGRITPGGTITEFPIPSSVYGQQQGNRAYAIVAGPDAALWFTTDTAIGRITTNGTITQYTIPYVNLDGGADPPAPDSMTVGPDGNLWFTMIGYSLAGQNGAYYSVGRVAL